MATPAPDEKPIILITGAAGNIGQSLARVLEDDYRIVGLDRPGLKADFPLIEADLGDDKSVEMAIADFRAKFGEKIASVVHLAAYFDFTGEENPLYRSINVEGTRRLLLGSAATSFPRPGPRTRPPWSGSG